MSDSAEEVAAAAAAAAPADVAVAEAEPLPASSSFIDVVPFCVSLPDSEQQQQQQRRRGVVGTVTFLADRSAVVWFGWGDLLVEPGENGGGTRSGGRHAGEGTDTDGGETQGATTGSGVPVMGPMVLSMPRTKYGGGSSEDDPASTQLIGGNSEEDMMMGFQMASRLSKKTGWPVYVSCALHTDAAAAAAAAGEGGGMEDAGFGGSLSQRAAARAEREVGRVLMKRKDGHKS